MTEADDLVPTFVVDVTPFWETKMRADRRLREPVHPRARRDRGPLPLDRFQETVELAARRHGQRIGVRYGEGFVTREPMAVDDLLALGGGSL